mgnify:CR=1 FL=1
MRIATAQVPRPASHTSYSILNAYSMTATKPVITKYDMRSTVVTSITVTKKSCMELLILTPFIKNTL